MSRNQVYLLFLMLCIFVVFLQAIHPAWKDHLTFDIYTYQDRAAYFINHLNLKGVNDNEYQPGAILYFLLLSPTLLISNTLNSFLTVFFIGNVLMVLLIGFLTQKFTDSKNIFLLSLVLLFTGPILFYRFELLVIFFVITSFFFWKKGQTYSSVILLAFATLIKVYPIIYLPYLLIILFRKKGFTEAFKHLLVFLGFIIIFTAVYLVSLQISLDQLIFSLDYHSVKPIGVEGLWSSAISTWNIVTTGVPPTLVAGNKTWGVNPSGFPLPVWFIDNYWIFILGVIYIYLLLSKKLANKFMEINILLTMALVTFSKLSSPQYLMWYLFLLPLISIEKYLKGSYYTVIFLFSLLVAFLSQYIYPLNYTNFLQFFSGGDALYLFYINLIKNIFLLTSFVLLIFYLDENETD